MPTGLEFHIEASNRLAQAKAIVRQFDTNRDQFENMFQNLQISVDNLIILYGIEEDISEDAYISLVDRLDSFYVQFVNATGGKEALVRDRTRPGDNWPLNFKLLPPNDGDVD